MTSAESRPGTSKLDGGYGLHVTALQARLAPKACALYMAVSRGVHWFSEFSRDLGFVGSSIQLRPVRPGPVPSPKP